MWKGMSMTELFLEDFILCITSYNWSPILWWHDFYIHQQANLFSLHVAIPSPKCFSYYDVISAATFQGYWASIIAARWHPVIHSTVSMNLGLVEELVEMTSGPKLRLVYIGEVWTWKH